MRDIRRAASVAFGAVLGVALMSLPVRAQTEEPETDSAPAQVNAKVKLDTLTLLREEQLQPGQITDPVWTISPAPGREFLQIPLTVEAGEADYELNSSALRLAGGKLAFFRFVYVRPGQTEADEATQQGELPEGVPRVARRITVKTDGTLAWKLDRVIVNGDITGSSDYALRINAEALGRLNPGPAPDVSRGQGEDDRSYYARRAAALAEHRARSDEFRALRKRVMDLSLDMTAPIPPLIYAVYEVRSKPRTLDLQGADLTPWSLPWEALIQMRNMVSVAALDAQGQLGDQVQEMVKTVFGHVASDDHPLTLRTAAFALASRHFVKLAQPDDVLYQLCQHILEGADVEARRLLIKELVSTIPPTAATVSLLKLVAADMDPKTKLLSLGSMLKANIADPVALREAARSAGQLLADPQGPTPEQVLSMLVATQDMTRDVARAMASQINLSALPDDRVLPTVRFIVERAPTSEPAAIWLDQLLLGAGDIRLITATLEVLADSELAGDAATPAVGRAFGALFGKRRNASATGKGVELSAPIPVPSPTHNLFRSLQIGDASLRALAWQSLRMFTFSQETPAATDATPSDPRFRQLTMAALSQNPLPLSVVEFLARQSDRLSAGHELALLAMQGRGEASTAAAKGFVGYPGAVRPLLLMRSPNERQALISSIYRAHTGREPLLTAVLRQRKDDAPVIDWLATELQAGRLPDPARWANAFRTVDELYELIPSNDLTLAQGAVAALTNAAGGDDAMALQLTQQLRALESTTVPALAEAWTKLSREVFQARLRTANGKFDASLTLWPARGSEDNTPPQPTRLLPVNLAPAGDTLEVKGLELQLKATDQGSFLLIEAPTQLRVLGGDLTNLPLEFATPPIRLLPMYDRSWRTRFALNDGRVIEIAFTPAAP